MLTLISDYSLNVFRELRVQREAEREKLKKCNNRLVNYIDKVHDLELANALLASENEKLRRREKTPETDVGALYEDELKVNNEMQSTWSLN